MQGLPQIVSLVPQTGLQFVDIRFALERLPRMPRSFWEQPLGKMLSLAKLRSYEPTELISIGQAANVLKVTRPTIYRWMDDRTLNYVRDDMSGRTFVVRRDIDNLKWVALELGAQE